MYKKIFLYSLTFIFLTIFFLSVPVYSVSSNQAEFYVGKNYFWLNDVRYSMDVAPYIKDNRTFMPLRFAAYAAGVKDEDILWDQALNTALLKAEDKRVKVKLGSRILYVDDKQVVMDVAPEIYKNRLMLPVRWIAEALDAQVEWNQLEKKITVMVKDNDPKNSELYFVEEDTLETAVYNNYDAFITKEYTWHDRYGNKWTWKVDIPEAIYSYSYDKLRLHEQLVKDYKTEIEKLKHKENEIDQQIEYWYWYYKIYPEDSPQEAMYKYQSLNQVMASLNQERIRLNQEYQRLKRYYEEEVERLIREGYVPYVIEQINFALVEKLAELLKVKAPSNDRDRIEFVAAFVQEALPYVFEEGEYPKYPAETLVEGGDCEDKSILLAALLKSLGYKTALLIFEGDPGHAAVGVECPGAYGSYFAKDGVKYFYIETTNKGWKTGQIPPEYQGKSALVFPVP
ncbi:stalk domain-containing protein [Thermosyntropha sp.]|uniref:stalk domain-containing protein n=1 Tax=Thermosyntropha sp. TaxID=2740820 RepID=UPI0025DB4497|nr:stalk domain-containing protein [Thermosyntropha sp.]MBO8159553.1 copper amine oxidase [Thermosyntropha sp.]